MSVLGYINDSVRLTGSVDGSTQLIGAVHASAQLIGEIQAGSVVVQEPDYYDGAYDIRPSIDSQTVATKDKTMREDLLIEAIPYAEVTNNANGVTVTIGV
jgi:hypothetical protein